MKKNKNIGFAIIIVFLVVFMGYFVMSQNTSEVSVENLEPTGETQVIRLSVENGKYVLNPSTVNKGARVRIEADISKMPGCSKSIVISSFNIRKTLTQKENTIEFTADKAGTFNIACSMNMYRGSFTVLENDGTKPAYVEPESTTGSSCGIGGGGCGCGG